MPTVLVTPRSLSDKNHPALVPLRDAGYEILIPAPGKLPSDEILLDVLPKCDGWLAGVEKITEKLIAVADRLKVISRNGVGVDNVDQSAAKAKGIQVAITPGANSRGVAELALGLIFTLARHITESDAAIKQGEWKRFQGFELEGKTLGIAGCGQIGRHLARMATGIGMNVLGCDIAPDPTFAVPGFSWCDFDGLIGKSDILSLHIPGGEKPVINEEMLKKVMPGLLLINTARASLIDDNALLAALDDKRIGGYGVDVFAVEPPGVTTLTSHPKVVCSPHAGGLTTESVARAAAMASENIVKVLGKAK